MKTLVVLTFFVVVHFVRYGSGISTLDNETYDVFLQLIKGEFSVPVKDRTDKQKSAVVRFWRNRASLSLRGGGLFFNGKAVVKKTELHDVVQKMYKSSKGSGARKIYHKLKECYSGVALRDVQKMLSKSCTHQRLNVRFENKARLRPVRARTVQIRHHIDVVNMQGLSTKFKGKTFKYVLSIIDVFSRYHWLVPLERKSSSHVARELIRVYKEHGAPRFIQHDQGPEFDGAVSALCKKLHIKVIKGRPYHPQSQGTIEKAHRSFQKNIMYDFLVMKKAGFNWVKSLPEYARTLNLDPKEELAWKSPFEIYYGRKPNSVETKGNRNVQEWHIASDRYQGMIHPSSKDYTDRAKKIRNIRNLANSATEQCVNRMAKLEDGSNAPSPPSTYDIGETVLIYYSPVKKLESRRHIVEAGIVKRNLRLQKYQVAFISPTSGKLIYKWIPVHDITSLTMEKEKRRSTLKMAKRRNRKKAHRRKYLQSYENERSLFEDRTGSGHFIISYDPPKDGNCQFSAICKLLNTIGIFRSNQTMRKEIVSHLEANPLQNFTDLPWPVYLTQMSQNGTYGDHLTLQAASDLYNVEFVVISSLGPGATTTISPMNSNPLCTFALGHFAENAGEHYVCLENEHNWNTWYSEVTSHEITASELSPSVTLDENNMPSDMPQPKWNRYEEVDESYAEYNTSRDIDVPYYKSNTPSDMPQPKLNRTEEADCKGKAKIVSKMHSKRINWLTANLEIKNCIFPLAHRTEP